MKNMLAIDLDRRLLIYSGQPTRESELIEKEKQAWEARLAKIKQMTDQVDLVRQQTIETQKKMMTSTLFQYVRDKNLMDLEDYLKSID